MRKLFIGICFIFLLITKLYSQETEKYDFIIYPFWGEPSDTMSIGFTVHRTILSDSIYIDKYSGEFAMTNEILKWRVKNGNWYYYNNKWYIYFDSKKIQRECFWWDEKWKYKMIWKSTRYIDKDEGIFRLEFKSIGFNSHLPTYYFTLSDGIIAIRGDLFFIRKDKLKFADDLFVYEY